MPLAVSATTRSGASAATSTKLRTWSANAPSRSIASTRPGGEGAGSTPTAVILRISARPVSWPIGRAPARHILMPLYRAGLWDAVNIAPGASRWPAAKYTRSVDARPRSTTSSPWRCTPSAKAAARSTPLSRMSRATSTRSGAGPPAAESSTKRAKAAPIRPLSAGSSWSGTMPLTS
jgi:hypothetical protein